MRIKIFANIKKPAVCGNLAVLRSILREKKIKRNNDEFDTAFVLGGDGWLLKVLSEIFMRKSDIYFFPMGENTFTKGFQISDAEKIASGKIKGVRYAPSYLKSFSPAFNEIIIKTGRFARCMKYEVTADGRKFAAEGDGVIVATPFGSSAYNAAAGGEVLSLGCESAVITPVISFTGRKKSVKVPLKSVIKIRITEKQGDVWEVIDGRESRAARDLTVIKSGKAACGIVFPPQ